MLIRCWHRWSGGDWPLKAWENLGLVQLFYNVSEVILTFGTFATFETFRTFGTFEKFKMSLLPQKMSNDVLLHSQKYQICKALKTIFHIWMFRMFRMFKLFWHSEHSKNSKWVYCFKRCQMMSSYTHKSIKYQFLHIKHLKPYSIFECSECSEC